MKPFHLLVLSLIATIGLASASAEKPNILWIFAEDTSPWMGCYGDEVNAGRTPHIDSLAEQGTLFKRAYVPAPVCSACRSALMAGMNQIRFGAHEHRSSRGPRKIDLPKNVKLLPQIMQEDGYYTFNLGKDDYNFVWDQKATYTLQRKNRADIPWDVLQANQPFYGQIQTAGGKQNTTKFPKSRKADPASVSVPLDYPQNQLYREVVAEHYDSIRKDDDFIGEVLAGLKQAGLWENTIVVYVSDHGANNLLRHKQMPTEGGLHVPFVVRAPEGMGIGASEVREDLVDILDLSATTLAWAGIRQPKWYEGQNLFGPGFMPRQFVASAKDRLDHTIDRVRTIRTDRFRYTRNYLLDRILLQPQYRDGNAYTIMLHEMYANGTLSPKLSEIYFGERKAEELYDVERDPHQLNNLAGDPNYAAVLEQHRALLDEWMAKGDAGAGEEPVEEIAFQNQGPAKWRKVNPEYEQLRQDSDGDGLSDEWEGYNDRDPKDGKLLFAFDCGGWQTEGWQGSRNLPNIAGYLGYLDFDLPNGKGSIARDGLAIDLSKNGNRLSVKARVSTPTLVWLTLDNGDGKSKRIAGPLTLVPTREFATASFDIPENGSLAGLKLDFKGDAGTFVEIDSIQTM